MALQVEVELGGVNYIGIHDRASRTIPTPICDVRCWEKPDVMSSPDDNDGDLGAYFSRLAGLWLILNERMINICRSARQTFNKGEFFLENLLKLSFRDPSPEEQNAFWRSIRLPLFDVSSVANELVDHRL